MAPPILPKYSKPTTIAEAEQVLLNRRTDLREWARVAETATQNTQGYVPILTAFASAERQAELDLLSLTIEEFVKASERRNVILDAIAKETATATKDAAAATLKAALAQENAVTQARNAVIVAAVLALITVVGMALRPSPPIVYNNVPPNPAPTVNVLPAPVTILPGPGPVAPPPPPRPPQ